MRALLIDNYDSFTFNLYQLLASVNGIEPLVVKNDHPDWHQLDMQAFDSVVISPGPGNPQSAKDIGHSADIIRSAHLPVLGVCLGHQAICNFFGARVGHAPLEMHGRVSKVTHDESELFANIPSPFSVVRYHSLAATELPDILEATAWTDDGVLMGVRHKELPMWGVQFHPESILTEYGAQLVTNFRQLALKARPSSSRLVVPDRPEIRTRTQTDVVEPRSVLWTKCDWVDPEVVYRNVFAASETSFWLDSSSNEMSNGQSSFMGDANGPYAEVLTYDTETKELQVSSNNRTERYRQSIFEYLDHSLAERAHAVLDLPFEFQLGYVGYLGYELKNECGSSNLHRSELPDARLVFADRVVVFDHTASDIYLLALGDASDRVSAAKEWFQAMENILDSLRNERAADRDLQLDIVLEEPNRRHSRERYLRDIADCQAEIHDGETYEVCLTNMLDVDRLDAPLDTYSFLRRSSPTPFGAFIKFPEFEILSSSPERFLKVDVEGRVEAKPIKGTVKRGRDDLEDEQLKANLRSEKEEAENLMIVDLLRNDLGSVCEVGSVEVPKLFDIETYATVHQLVSTVSGTLRPGASAVNCVAAAFPGGSMTGAPKIRTMAIIDRIEGGARGVYSGALGYFALNGAADWSIVIRTIVNTERRAYVGVGGAITALSDPVAEFDETTLKSRGVLTAITACRVAANEREARIA